ncbi:MAG: hypothetical protein PVH50_07155 [Anaerolineae bacterium]
MCATRDLKGGDGVGVARVPDEGDGVGKGVGLGNVVAVGVAAWTGVQEGVAHGVGPTVAVLVSRTRGVVVEVAVGEGLGVIVHGSVSVGVTEASDAGMCVVVGTGGCGVGAVSAATGAVSTSMYGSPPIMHPCGQCAPGRST